MPKKTNKNNPEPGIAKFWVNYSSKSKNTLPCLIVGGSNKQGDGHPVEKS